MLPRPKLLAFIASFCLASVCLPQISSIPLAQNPSYYGLDPSIISSLDDQVSQQASLRQSFPRDIVEPQKEVKVKLFNPAILTASFSYMNDDCGDNGKCSIIFNTMAKDKEFTMIFDKSSKKVS